MDSEFWVDGFNFFHSWENTRGWLRPDSGLDVVRAMERSLRTLGRQLGSRCRGCVVYMDGGLTRGNANLGALRVRYAGPGKKADDRMVFDLEELGGAARLVTVVTNDRELRGRARGAGAGSLAVGEYVSLLGGKQRGGGGGGQRGKGRAAPGGGERNRAGSRAGISEAEVLREKTRALSASEVAAWLEFFGGDAEG